MKRFSLPCPVSYFAFSSGLALLSLTAGCSTQPARDYSGVQLQHVSGTVTADGKPLANGLILFEAPDKQFSAGPTDENGYYQLRFDSRKLGVTPGEKIVRIYSARKINGFNSSEEVSTVEGVKPQKVDPNERVPSRYNEKSELKRTVTSEPSQTFDFDLELK